MTGKRQASDRQATASIERVESIERIDNNNIVDILNVSDSEVAESIERDHQIEEAALSVGLTVSPSSMDKARDLSYRYGLNRLLEAINASIDVPKWSYVEGILRNEQREMAEAEREAEENQTDHQETMKQHLIKAGRWDEEYQCEIGKAEMYRAKGFTPEEARQDMERIRENRIRQYERFRKGREQ